MCGNEGHKSFECPNKKPVKKEKEPDKAHANTVDAQHGRAHMGDPIKGNIMRGKVNGCDVDILIDSGADYGLVPANTVPPKAYLGQKCWITGVGDEPVLFELAEAWLGLSGTHVRRKVAVDTRPKPKPWCLLLIDLK